MPTKINLFVPAKQRAAENRATLQKKAAARLAGQSVEKPSKGTSWKEATGGAEARASMTSDVLKSQMTNPDPSLQQRMSEPIKTPSGGRAAGALTKEPMPKEVNFKDVTTRESQKTAESVKGFAQLDRDRAKAAFIENRPIKQTSTATSPGTTPEDYHEFIGRGQKSAVDLGEKEPGATLATKARARGIAASIREGRSSIGDNMSHEAPSETDLHSGGRPWTPQSRYGTASVTDTGESAGAFNFKSDESRAPKDLGRVTAKAVRGEYGELSPKTAGQVKGSFLGRAAESVKGAGEVLGSYGTLSLAAKATEALQGMRQGKTVNPLSLETSTPKEGAPVLTPTGVKKAPKPPVES